MSDYQTALVGLINELNDWRDAGGDTFKLVSALQYFIHEICADREAAIAEANARGTSSAMKPLFRKRD